METPRPCEISIGTALRNGEGIIKLLIEINSNCMELSIKQAREIAELLIEACNATLADESVFKYFRALGDLEMGQRVVNAMRKDRHANDSRWDDDEFGYER